jgi:hypothetical protein
MDDKRRKWTLFTFGQEPRHEGNSPDITGHRWTLNIGAWPVAMVRGFFVSIDHEYQRDGAEWCPGVHYFTASLTPAWRLGGRHDYYDGPHCAFSFGYLHLCWSWWWCRKCMPDPAEAA